MPVRQENGAEGARTPDLLGAIQALSQLSYSPETRHPAWGAGRPDKKLGGGRKSVKVNDLLGSGSGPLPTYSSRNGTSIRIPSLPTHVSGNTSPASSRRDRLSLEYLALTWVRTSFRTLAARATWAAPAAVE